jgi:hypothetical protein
MLIPPIKGKLSLEWVILTDGCPALAFDKPTWAIYEQAAGARGQTAQHMIAASVAAAFGHVIADNYAANRREDATDAIMTNDLRQPIDKNTIRAKLVELIQRAAEHGVDIEALIYEASIWRTFSRRKSQCRERTTPATAAPCFSRE